MYSLIYIYVFIVPCVFFKFWTGSVFKEMLINSNEYVCFALNNEGMVFIKAFLSISNTEYFS